MCAGSGYPSPFDEHRSVCSASFLPQQRKWQVRLGAAVFSGGLPLVYEVG